MRRRSLLLTGLAAPALPWLRSSSAHASTVATQPAATQETENGEEQLDFVWHDVTADGVEGRGFADTAAPFDRMPARAETLVRPEVWTRSRHTTGMAVRFEADTPRIDVNCRLLNDSLAMPHMPATGVSGLDLYCRHADRWRWVSVFRPKTNPLQGPLVDRLAPGNREFLLYFPLYNGVTSLRLGVPPDAHFRLLPPRDTIPLLFYGTSITHGACASRPGMAFVNILGRRLDRPVLNFGFSGNGKTEPEVAALLAELDPAMFVLDCVANTPGEHVEERSYAAVRTWREAHPGTPIVMVESRTWSSAELVANRAATHRKKRAALRRAYKRLVNEGLTGLHYVEGGQLLGDDHEATTDGSHPSDLGMMRYADALEPVLRQALDEPVGT